MNEPVVTTTDDKVAVPVAVKCSHCAAERPKVHEGWCRFGKAAGSILLCPDCVAAHTEVKPEETCVKCGHARRYYHKTGASKWTIFGRRMVCPNCTADFLLTRTASIPLDCVLRVDVFDDGHEEARKVWGGHEDIRDWDKKNPTPLDKDSFLNFESLMLALTAQYTDAAQWCLNFYERHDPVTVAGVLRPDLMQLRKDGQWVDDNTRSRLLKPLPLWEEPAKEAYNTIRSLFPLIPASSVTCVTSRCASLYRELRWQRHAKNTRRIQIEYPHPLLFKAVAVELEERTVNGEQRYVLVLKLGGTPNYVLHLGLSNDRRHFSRQLEWLDKVKAGNGKLGDLTLYFKEATRGKFHQRMCVGQSFARSKRRVDCCVSVRLEKIPPAKAVDPNRVMMLTARPDCLFDMTKDGYALYVCNHPEMLALAKLHKRRLQLFSEDMKFGNSKRRRNMKEKRKNECEGHDKRLDGAVKWLAAKAMSVVEQHQCGHLVVNVAHGQDFRWRDFKDALKHKCEERHVVYEESTAPLPQLETRDEVVYNDAEKDLNRERAKEQLTTVTKVIQKASARRQKVLQANQQEAVNHHQAVESMTHAKNRK